MLTSVIQKMNAKGGKFMKMLKLMLGVMTGIFLMGLVSGCGTTSNNLSVSSSSSEANTRLLYNFATPPTAFISDANTIALFHMNESSGVVVDDASSNNSDGATVAAPVFNTSGRFDRAVSLNGTTQFVNVTSNATMDLTNKLTVQAWVMPRSVAVGTRTIASKWSTAGNLSWNLQLFAAAPRLLLSSNGTTIFTFTSTAALVANQWAHIAAMADGSFVSIYVNGVLAGKFLYNAPIYNGTAALRIGADNATAGGTNFWGGLIDEVLIKKDASAAQPLASAVVDSSANNIYGQLVGNIDNATSPIDAYYLALSGTAQFVQATSPALSIQGPWTAEGYVRTTSITTPQNILTKGSVVGNNLNYGIQITSTIPTGRVRVFFNDDFANVYEVYSVTQIATNTWYHVAGTWDGATLRVYVNGNLESAVTYGAGITPALNTVGVNIGRDSAGANSFTGHIDKVRISDIARTSFLQ